MAHETLEEQAMRELKAHNVCPECVKCLEMEQRRGYPFGSPTYKVTLEKDGYHYHFNGEKCHNLKIVPQGNKCKCYDCKRLEEIKISSVIWNTALAR